MKATLIRVEDMQLKFELLETETDAPVIYRYYAPQLVYTRTLSDSARLRDPIRFIGHNYVFCSRVHRVYIWDLLRLDHADVRRGLEEFLKSHFHPTDHKETQR